MRTLLLALALIAAPAAAQTDRVKLAESLQPLVEAGDAGAAYHLGMMRSLGIGGEKDPLAAFNLFKLGAEGGDALAAYKLGDDYQRGVKDVVEADPALALQWKLVSAEAGYALAQHDVARLYFNAGDTDSALEWLTRAAGQGNGEALRALASLHNSDAIPKDAPRTYAYYKLFLARLAAPTEAQTKWISDFAATMSDEDRARGDAIIADWKAEPTPLTKQAQSGLRAAESLLAPEPAAKPAKKRPVGR